MLLGIKSMSSEKRTGRNAHTRWRSYFMSHRNSNIAVYKIQIVRRKVKSRSKSNKGGALAAGPTSGCI